MSHLTLPQGFCTLAPFVYMPLLVSWPWSWRVSTDHVLYPGLSLLWTYAFSAYTYPQLTEPIEATNKVHSTPDQLQQMMLVKISPKQDI